MFNEACTKKTSLTEKKLSIDITFSIKYLLKLSNLYLYNAVIRTLSTLFHVNSEKYPLTIEKR